MKGTFIIVESEDGDWIGLYDKDGLLYDEGNSLNWERIIADDNLFADGYDKILQYEIRSEVLVDTFGGSFPYKYSEVEEDLIK